MTMNHGGHGTKMDRLQERAIAALLDEPTITEAAAAVGIDESTLRAWLRNPAFREAYRQARADVLERTVARLVALTGEAVETLRRNLSAARAGDQIRAATAILGHVTRGLEVHDLATQLRELGEQVEADLEARRLGQARAGGRCRPWAPRHLRRDGGNGNGQGDHDGDQGGDQGDHGGGGGNGLGDRGGQGRDHGDHGRDPGDLGGADPGLDDAGSALWDGPSEPPLFT
jgi:hypothetical protein